MISNYSLREARNLDELLVELHRNIGTAFSGLHADIGWEFTLLRRRVDQALRNFP